jgi:hypothetical protein
VAQSLADISQPMHGKDKLGVAQFWLADTLAAPTGARRDDIGWINDRVPAGPPIC